MYECISCMHVNAPMLCNVRGSQKMASDLLKLEVASMWVLETKPGSSARAMNVLNC